MAGDYRAIYQQFKGEKLFLVLDPPYLQTIQNSYQMHFGLGEFLDLMDILREAEIWILFSSERSDIKPFLEWQNKHFDLKQSYHYHRANLTNARGLDMMIWKKR